MKASEGPLDTSNTTLLSLPQQEPERTLADEQGKRAICVFVVVYKFPPEAWGCACQ